MENLYLEFVNHYDLEKNDYVVAAISGGPDSMALLNMLIEASKKINFKIVCAHVNHGLRVESEKEKIMVEKFCSNHNVIFEYMKIESYNKDNFHNDARKKRYSFFESLIKKYNAKYLFTAHHADDLAETILMRISRGSTIQGYAGFSKFTKNKGYIIARPLIEMSKDYILNYVNENDIPYAIDNSNAKDVYTRNRIRKYIIPELKKENYKILQKVNQFSETLFMYANYVDSIVKEKYSNIVENNILNIEKFNEEEELIKINVLQEWLASYYGDDIILINNTHIKNLLNFLLNNDSNGSIDLPSNIIILKEYNNAILLEKEEVKEYYFEFGDNIKLPNGYTIEKTSAFERNNNYICLLNSSEIKLPLYIRTKRDGDKMQVKGMEGTKKIGDIFTNEKISIRERNEWPVVTDAEGNIVWLPGLKKSNFDKQKDEKYDIILRYH